MTGGKGNAEEGCQSPSPVIYMIWFHVYVSQKLRKKQRFFPCNWYLITGLERRYLSLLLGTTPWITKSPLGFGNLLEPEPFTESHLFLILIRCVRDHEVYTILQTVPTAWSDISTAEYFDFYYFFFLTLTFDRTKFLNTAGTVDRKAQTKRVSKSHHLILF